MSDPLLDKMDALLKKHHGAAGESPAAASNAPPPLPEDAWLPVLTDVVAAGAPDAGGHPAPAPQAAAGPGMGVDPEMLIAQIMGELEPRLTSLLRDRLLAELRNSLDESLSALLAQMDVHIREIVREAVAEQLNRP